MTPGMSVTERPGVRRILDNAADTAVFRPAYAAGFLVGNLVGGVALILLGRKWSR